MAVDTVASSQASPVTAAIRQAAQSTGVSFQYLLTTAKIESSLDPSAQASTSSAKGLYQFIDQTWLGTMKQDGAALGYGQYADAISKTASGRYEVEDPTARAAIMKLRGDPTASSMMAGALARNNAFQMTGSIGRRPTEGELYVAHFLGVEGASKLINATGSRPNANAAAMFPSAATANRNIFYDRSGDARSVGEVYARLTGRFDNTSAAVAALPIAAPDTAGVAQVLADAHGGLPRQADTKPLFQAMFTDRAGRPVSPTVATLWTPAAGTGTPDTGPDQDHAKRVAANMQAAAPAPTSLLDLFTDGATSARGLFLGAG